MCLQHTTFRVHIGANFKPQNGQCLIKKSILSCHVQQDAKEMALHYYDNLVLTTIEKEVSQHHNFAYKN
jgi:hypothetical protein